MLKRNLFLRQFTLFQPQNYVKPRAIETRRLASDRLTFTDDSLGSLPGFRVSFTVIPRLRRVSVYKRTARIISLFFGGRISCELSLCTFSATSAIRSGAFANSMFRAIALVKLFVSRLRRRIPDIRDVSDIRRPTFHRDIFHGETID